MEFYQENLTVDLNPEDIFDTKISHKETSIEDIPKNIKIKNELDVSIERKCGEIYFGNDIFYLNCNYCGARYQTIKVFTQHFIQNHLNLNVDQTILALKKILSDDDENDNWNDTNIKVIGLNFEGEVQEELPEENKCNEFELFNEEDIKDEIDIEENSFKGDIDKGDSDFDSFWIKEEIKVKKPKGRKRRRTAVELNINGNENLNEEQSDDKRKWICSVCNQPFTRRDNMLRHKWKIHKEKPNPDYGEIRLDCKWCGQHFKRHSDRSRHENQQHEPDGTKINRRRNYKENPLERHVCETCGNSYKHAWSLQEHLRIHTGERPFVCNLCNATFAKRQNFIVHQKYHSGERRFKCQYCDKGFVQKTKLILHEMVHTGTYKAQCNICGRQFRCGSRLNVHMKRHLYDKCHKCEICEKRFYTADSLKRHTAIHSDKKPFRCDICLAEYFTKCSLQKHVKRRHKPVDCQVSNKPNLVIISANSIINPPNSTISPTNSIINPTNVIINHTNSINNPTNSTINPTNSTINHTNSIINSTNSVINSTNIVNNPIIPVTDSTVEVDPSSSLISPTCLVIRPEINNVIVNSTVSETSQNN